ncbi:MAG: cobalamin biosynthesis protein [Candidatus Bathyarchaeota archaeon]|nr:cobalamin biosynthesis protein [Candidatus Bathyarchaeota archaeon]
MYANGVAVVAITRRGVETAQQIKDTLQQRGISTIVYAPKKYSQKGVTVIQEPVSAFIRDTYNTVDALVGVMATGIIIRSIAPMLESKLSDPAVVGVDTTGKFVISLLSGHFGGANELTKIIAGGIGAEAVITTATEVSGKLSVDELARIMHFSIKNPESLVAVNTAIVNGDSLVLVLVGDVKVPLENVGCFEVKKAKNGAQAMEIISAYDAGIIVAQKPLSIAKFVKPFTILKPKKIVVGVGARKVISKERIIKTVKAALATANLPLSRINGAATVDIKKDSKPLVEAFADMGLPLQFFSAEQLSNVSSGELSPDSKMVMEKIGVGGVCERAALLAAGNNSKLILKKTKQNGVTVALAEAE